MIDVVTLISYYLTSSIDKYYWLKFEPKVNIYLITLILRINEVFLEYQATCMQVLVDREMHR